MENTREQTRISNEIKILLDDIKHLEFNIHRMNSKLEDKKILVNYFKGQIK